MTKVLAVHSHGGGTGKSNSAANIATVLATQGLDVCLVDTDVQSPGLHVLFGLTEAQTATGLCDYLLGECEIEDTVYDLTHRLPSGTDGSLVLVPGRVHAGMIAQLVGRGYDAGLLDEGLQTLISDRAPDVMVLDTHSGVTNETMIALAWADALTIVVRDDEQEYRGAQVTVAVTRLLNCPRTVVVVNMVPVAVDSSQVAAAAQRAYGCEVAAVIPYCPEAAELASDGIFVLQHPAHALTASFRSVAATLLGSASQRTSTAA